MFYHSTNVVVSGGQFTAIQQGSSGIKELGKASAPAAIHNSGERVDAQPENCHLNTRVAELDRIMSWILYKENAEALIMWLFGPAASGKSAIAQTLAERCHTLGILLASFFFSRSDPSRNHPRSLLATIAYQVVINFPDSRDVITRVPEQDPLVLTQSFEAQLTSLIIGPLQQLYLAGRCTGSSNPYLIIIDGLDECAHPQVQVNILSSISKALKTCTFPLKFFISSRPEVHLTTEFNSRITKPILAHLALDNKSLPVNDDAIHICDTTDRLKELRRYMTKDNLDYYIVPSEDSHGSEHVAASDKRLEFISGFTGSSGQAIITPNSAYLFTDSRHWTQAQEEIDHNWTLVKCGSPGAPQDWIEWLAGRVRDSRIGLDARMISHENATFINIKIQSFKSKLIYPPQNLVDRIWREKPEKPHGMVYIYSTEFAGESAVSKLEKLKEWVRQQPDSIPSYSMQQKPLGSQMHVATLLTSLSYIAYLLNLRGSDILYGQLFQAYLFVGLYDTILFVDPAKLHDDVVSYLHSIKVKHRHYNDLWPFLRRREWGEGKILISPQTSYAIALMLTHFRYTIAPSYIENMMSVKNETEIEGMRRAYLRDGLSFVRFLAWLESKLTKGYDITEYEAAFRLTEFRRKNKYFQGLTYENNSASGPNAALPRYTPNKSSASLISCELPYLNGSGASYNDGICDTTRTLHFGHPSSEMCEAYTDVLRIAIDSAIFPQGISGQQLGVLAHKSLWDGLKDLHGTSHGFGSVLTMHESPHGFTSGVPLVPGQVITNKPGFYLEGKWGMRIESALVVKRVKAQGKDSGKIWLGFERFTCVPIQMKMVKEDMLTKEEKQWLKDHNQQCYEKLSPSLQNDKYALKWLKRAAGID